MAYTLSQEAVSFFMHSYFGIELKELENRNQDSIITKCAQRAYLDLNRTLRFTENTTNAKLTAIEAHQNFRNDICNVIKKQICTALLGSDKTNSVS